MAEPPTFSGSDSKITLQNWLNQIALYCSASKIVTDYKKIVTVLSRIRSLAADYLEEFYTHVNNGKTLGTWNNFKAIMETVYRCKNCKLTTWEEMDKLWEEYRKDLTKKNYIWFSEEYSTLACLIDYEESMHISKLELSLLQDLQAMTTYNCIKETLPTTVVVYLNLMVEIFKSLHPDKVKDTPIITGKLRRTWMLWK